MKITKKMLATPEYDILSERLKPPKECKELMIIGTPQQDFVFSKGMIEDAEKWPKCGIIKPFTGKERPPSNHKRIYKPGGKFKTMNELVKWLDIGDYVFWQNNRRAFHPGWIRGFQIGYVMWNLRAGNIRKAVRINAKPR